MALIDYESQIYTAVRNAVVGSDSTIKVSGTTNLTPNEFPSVFVEEIDNNTYTASVTSCTQPHANLMYEVNIFTNNVSGSKSKAKAILKVVSDTFEEMGFIRSSVQPFSLDNGTKYRIFARFTAICDENGQIAQ